MTTIYVLLIFWLGDNTWRPANLSVEFTSQQNCEVAGQQALRQMEKIGAARKATYVCVLK